MRQLPPWFENLGKRLVKAPKVYIRDSGLLHALLGLTAFRELEAHPKLGASWEGFVIEHVVRRVGDRDTWFWATQSGAELDLFVRRGARRVGIEVKYQDAPTLSRSMRIAMADLRLDELLIAYPGDRAYALAQRIHVLPLEELLARL